MTAMPTIEFFGMHREERDTLEKQVRELLTEEEFREDCVFVTAADSRVLDWTGHRRPFIRVSTRSEHRADRFRNLLQHICDLEIVRIDFQPMAGSSSDEGQHNG
ncbi:hypothetical protein ACGFNV_44695 [Streptomyces sp. NPDC048751]|uniref:hypothetical protein n=1 Tax=Streptomyces sp. NPDC048751 TaxID=3365591 RepID=UPI0037139FFB